MGLLNMISKAYRIASDTLDEVLAGIETSALEKAANAYDETRPVSRITGPVVVMPSPTSSDTPSLEKLAIYGWDEENLTDSEARSIIIKAVPGHSHDTLACKTRKQLIEHIERLIHCWLCNRVPELEVKQTRPEPQEQQISLFKPTENTENFLPREYFSPYHPHLGDKAVMVKTIGVGGFGTVYQMRSHTGKRSADDHPVCLICNPIAGTSADMTVARKVLRQSDSLGEEDIKNEIRALDKLCRADRGEFLVQVFHHRPADDTSPSTGVYQIDMELCLGNLKRKIGAQKTSMREILSKMTPLNNDFEDELNELNSEVCNILLDILRGLSFIHSLCEVHRDLKPENVVLFSYIHQRWKISDFGTSAEGTSKRLQHTTLQRGTSSYRAPEVVKNGSYNNKTDIWAFGCIAYELCTKTPAFSGDWEMLFFKDASTKTIFNFPRLGLKGHAVSVAQDINLRCVAKTLCPDVDARPSATCLLMYLNAICERKADLE